MESELLDWELVHGSDTESTDSVASKKSSSSSVIDDGMILSDHFPADDHLHGGVVETGDSFRVDYGSDYQITGDLGFVSNELGFYDSKSGASGDGDFDEKQVEDQSAVEKFTGEVSEVENQSPIEELTGEVSEVQNHSPVEEEPIEDSSKSWCDSWRNEVVSGDSEIVNGEEEEKEVDAESGVVVSSEAVEGSVGGEDSVVHVGDVNSPVRSGVDESKSRETVWWKMPFVLLKYSAFRIGPVWSVSMAAAVMGFVLLGRRLYNMKKKAQRFNLKVTIDDKKVSSRVMSQAARLNEVFMEVRRVPVIRPALPSPGAWPVLSLR